MIEVIRLVWIRLLSGNVANPLMDATENVLKPLIYYNG